MKKLLLNLFVKNWKNGEDPVVRAKTGRLSGITGIICNLLLCGFKLAVGLLSGSVSITADAMNNLSDAVSSVVTYLGFKLAEKPADEEHPYGHARYEYLSGLAVAALILVIGVELARNSVEKILHPQPVALTALVFAVLAASVLVKLWLCRFNGFLGRHIGSQTLLATAQDSRNDVITTTAVAAAGVVEMLTQWQIDGYAGLGVAAFIIYSGCNLAKQTISPLLGESASPQLRQKILRIVDDEPQVLGYHDLMVHDYGPGQRFASLHVEMDGREDPLLCHEIIDQLERKCMRKYQVRLVIHYDPVVTGDARLEELRGFVEKVLKEQDPGLNIHDFRMFQGQKHINLMFDVSLPPQWNDWKAHLRKTVEDALEAKAPGAYHAHITFDLESA